MRWIAWIFRGKKSSELPDSLTKLRPGDPCWCGSERTYARCHRREDRRIMRALGIDKAGLRNNPFV
ncbi:SEC-C domain-containing protein [Geoalkalibacter sp.]|uniref:SEC-C domain-containing protein n=1 Tax=Geoalkalibacter sp. TaxID=3041440 RepID=UPI003FA5EFAD